MNEQRVFQQILTQANQLDAQVHLKIPADQASIQQQVKRIETAEQHLKAVKNQVLRRLAKAPNDLRSNGSQQGNYHSLIQRIEKTLRNAVNQTFSGRIFSRSRRCHLSAARNKPRQFTKNDS